MQMKWVFSIFFCLILAIGAGAVYAYRQHDPIYLAKVTEALQPIVELREKFENVCAQNYQQFLTLPRDTPPKQANELWRNALIHPDDSLQIKEISSIIKQVRLEPIADVVALVHVHLKQFSRPMFAKNSWLGWLKLTISPIEENATLSFRMACDRTRFMFLIHRVDFDLRWLPKTFVYEALDQ